MLSMFGANIFYPEVVNNEGELDRLLVVCPEAMGVGGGMMGVFGQVFGQLLIGDYSSLG
jgi:hypothetical protein